MENRAHAAFGTVWRCALEARRAVLDSGFARSRWLGRAADRNGAALPWLSYPAIRYLERVARPGMSVYEYGCGQSTLWFLGRLCDVSGVESDPGWAEFVETRAARLGLKPSVRVARGVEDYSRAPVGADLAVVDGDFRLDCARRLSKDCAASVILDNAESFPEARDELRGKYAHYVPLVGPAPGYIEIETALFF